MTDEVIPSLEDTQEIAEVPLEETPKDTVVGFPKRPYRYTAEALIRNLMGQIDKVEDLIVVFRNRKERSLSVGYSGDIPYTDFAIAGLTLTGIAQDMMAAYTTSSPPPPKDKDSA